MQEAESIGAKAVYEFEGFRVDPLNRILLRDGEVVPLTAKVFDLLLVLLKNNGRLVKKDDIMRWVWPQNYVEEGNLTRCVSSLRKALGESPKSHRYIVTVPGYGYKFAAELKVVEETPVSMPIAEQTVSSTIIEDEVSLPTVGESTRAFHEIQRDSVTRPETKKMATKLLLVTPVFLVAILLTALLIPRKEGPGARPAQTPMKSIAVLPLKPLNTEKRDPVYELGIADSLILKLSSAQELIVRPLSATRKYTDPEQDPLAAGREQQVDYVLSPSYQLTEDKIRVTAQLLNVRDGSVASVFKCDEKCTDIFEVQDLISKQIAGELALNLSNEEHHQLTKSLTSNAEAYHLYLLARYHWFRFNPEGWRKCIEYSKQAIAKDPNFARAYGMLSMGYAAAAFNGALDGKEFLPLAEAATRKALALDETIGEAHLTVAAISYYYEHNWPAAELEFKRGLELSPNYAEGHRLYGVALAYTGRVDEGLTEVRRAHELDPLSVLNTCDIGRVLSLARRFDESIEQLHRALEMDPNYSRAYSLLIPVYERIGRYEEALAARKKALELSGAPDSPITLKAPYAKSDYNRVLTVLSKNQLVWLKHKAKQEYVSPMTFFYCYLGAGDYEQAYEWGRKAEVDDHANVLFDLQVDTAYGELRSEPRFVQLLQRLSLPHEPAVASNRMP
jgi:DNA-binding winged helix-turn-helix (wHTH) protein/TolB-like protein